MSLRQTDRGDKMRQVQIKDIVKAVGGKLVWGDENATVTNVSTDSREVKTGTLFVPIIGECVDAHRFIPDVLEAGASCVFFSDDREKERRVPEYTFPIHFWQCRNLLHGTAVNFR